MSKGHPFSFYFSVFLRVSVCVVCVCASRSPGPRKEQHERDDELYIESAPSHRNLYSYLLNVHTPSIQLYIFLTFSHTFSPNSYTIFKRLFAFTMRLPPTNICTILPTFPRDFPQKTFTILVPTPCVTHLGTFVCIDSRRLAFT